MKKKGLLEGPSKKDALLGALREERRALRDIVEKLEAGVPFNNDVGGPRRTIIQALLMICALELHPIHPDLLLAAQMILAYNDLPARLIISNVAENDYRTYIKKAKGK